jgi:hypothetical protein
MRRTKTTASGLSTYITGKLHILNAKMPSQKTISKYEFLMFALLTNNSTQTDASFSIMPNLQPIWHDSQPNWNHDNTYSR